jgi:lipopolysaccharide transport protein LptA
LLAAAVCPPAAPAQSPTAVGVERKEKIHISSESLVVNDAEKFAEFIGNVKAVQGTTEIVSDRLKIYYEGNPRPASGGAPEGDGEARDSIKRIVATGHVKIHFDDTVAESREAVYTTADRILVLSGPNSKVTKPSSGEISGSKISIHRDSGQIKFEGNVEGLFFPGEKGLN